MGGDHRHGHDHAPGAFDRAFLTGIVLNGGFVVVEAGYGFASNSMALIADAGHNLGDVLGLVVAYIGARLVRRRASARFTYGLKKSSILAALINALLMLVAVGGIGVEAVHRLLAPESADGATVMTVAAIGILVNSATALMFARGRTGDLNVRGAYLHMLADAAVSAGVVVAGALTLWTGERWIDPAASLMVAAIILWGTWGLLTEATAMTLAGTPRGIDPAKVGSTLEQLPGVAGTHHLHIWPLSTTETAMTVHLIVDAGVDRDRILLEANDVVRDRFGIAHSTVQVERAPASGDDCGGGC